MCIICVKPEGKEIDRAILRRMWDRNSDGAGFMYAQDGKLRVQKGFMKYNDFLAEFEKVENHQVVMHFRIKTHGKTNEVNTHPFIVKEGELAFAHNGVISKFGSADFSDTYHFNEEIIKPISQAAPNFLSITPLTKLFEDRIGHSKLVFMDAQGEVTIINKQLGEESSDGFWFSNGGWQDYSKRHDTKSFPQQQSSNYYNSWYNDFYGGEDNKENKVETKTTSSSSQCSLKTGDAVQFLFQTSNISRNTIGRVAWVGQYNYIGVDVGDAQPRSVHISMLKKAEICEMIQDVGHLKKGHHVLFDMNLHLNKDMCQVYDPVKSKYYQVPNSSVIILANPDYNEIEWLEDFWSVQDPEDFALSCSNIMH